MILTVLGAPENLRLKSVTLLSTLSRSVLFTAASSSEVKHVMRTVT